MPSHFAGLGGTPVHYLRFDGERPDALPIVITYGRSGGPPSRARSGPTTSGTA